MTSQRSQRLLIDLDDLPPGPNPLQNLKILIAARDPADIRIAWIADLPPPLFDPIPQRYRRGPPRPGVALLWQQKYRITFFRYQLARQGSNSELIDSQHLLIIT